MLCNIDRFLLGNSAAAVRIGDERRLTPALAAGSGRRG
jgi:hypothetical protein